MLTPYWLLTSIRRSFTGVSRTPARPTPSCCPFTPAAEDMATNSSEFRGLMFQMKPPRYWTQPTLPPSVTASKVFGVIRLSCGLMYVWSTSCR